MKPSRDRHQIVVVMGEGEIGKRPRDRVTAAAEAVGKPVSTWAREVLLAEAAGDGLKDAGARLAGAVLADLEKAREHLDREIACRRKTARKEPRT